MKTNLTNGPSVKSLVSQYEQKVSAYQSPTNKNEAKTGQHPELRTASTEHLKKQQPPKEAVLRGYIDKDTESPSQNQVQNHIGGYLIPNNQGQVNNYKNGDLAANRQEQVNQYLTMGKNGQLEDRSCVRVFRPGEIPAELEPNHGPVTYLQGAENLDPSVDWKTKGANLPSYLKGYAFNTPAAAIDGLRVEKPGSFAFYKPETKATDADGQPRHWEWALAESGGNQELAVRFMYQTDSTRLGVAVKGQNGDVSRFELPMKYAHECPTQKSLVYQINQATGQQLDPAKMADASYMFRS